MYHIQKTCGGDLKPGLRLSEGRDTWSHLQGATQQVIVSQEGTASKAEMHVVGHQKTSSARGENRGQSTELVSTWTSRAAQQGRQESHLPRNIKTATLDRMPQSRSQRHILLRTPKYLFSSLSCSTTFIPTDLTSPLGWGSHPWYYLDQSNHKRSFIACSSSAQHLWQHDRTLHRDTLIFSCSIWPTSNLSDI